MIRTLRHDLFGFQQERLPFGTWVFWVDSLFLHELITNECSTTMFVPIDPHWRSECRYSPGLILSLTFCNSLCSLSSTNRFNSPAEYPSKAFKSHTNLYTNLFPWTCHESHLAVSCHTCNSSVSADEARQGNDLPWLSYHRHSNSAAPCSASHSSLWACVSARPRAGPRPRGWSAWTRPRRRAIGSLPLLICLWAARVGTARAVSGRCYLYRQTPGHQCQRRSYCTRPWVGL